MDTDKPEDALEAVTKEVFELMLKFEKGVPPTLIFAASTAASDRTTHMLGAMLMEVAAVVHGWSDDEKQIQMGLTTSMLQLISADALRDVLTSNTKMNNEGDENDGQETENIKD